MAFGAYYTNKSYYHRFTTINFAKPSWRAYTSMIPFIPNLAESGGSHRDNHHFQRMIARKERTAPQHTRFILPPIHPDKIIAALLGRYFFTNRTLCGCTILWNSLSVVCSTTSKRYSCAWKKQDTVSALCPAFFIPNLESFISRLNVILRHNLTLSVGEPDNAAAQTGAGTSFGANGDPIT